MSDMRLDRSDKRTTRRDRPSDSHMCGSHSCQWGFHGWRSAVERRARIPGPGVSHSHEGIAVQHSRRTLTTFLLPALPFSLFYWALCWYQYIGTSRCHECRMSLSPPSHLWRAKIRRIGRKPWCHIEHLSPTCSSEPKWRRINKIWGLRRVARRLIGICAAEAFFMLLRRLGALFRPVFDEVLVHVHAQYLLILSS
ncbi:hypothetical protein B0H63DRAFT_109666 [Podospora didyma]|uniref:Uncharacterized protein n=1 Tax=Podospora didyma TaxID=330526 RepID=A0AAE0U486_9PEZI|nr:hypothetical protein B0H63DRAFT_109666 [Podospora didyma]